MQVPGHQVPRSQLGLDDVHTTLTAYSRIQHIKKSPAYSRKRFFALLLQGNDQYTRVTLTNTNASAPTQCLQCPSKAILV